ncbi:hypothetical protein [Pantoea sp. ME81]|uniref:RipA family octameric membrane protein n=1 Tax=Pantoea sp. ME81 TaxID=2743935 RepID=UPI0015F73560|nr:hypothetical protein [Pantoea sp. ME81]
MEAHSRFKPTLKKNHIKVRAQDLKYLRDLLDDKRIMCGDILATHIDGKLKESINYLKIKEAYAKAHDIRKFEIELYWKRANHFWIFMTALAGLVGFSINSTQPWIQAFSPGLTIVGFVFGLAFYCANKGSKYWQENWEKNLDKLEYYVSGDLYKISLDMIDIKPSVSRVNLYVSVVINILWAVAFIWNLIFVSYNIIPYKYNIYYAILFSSFFLYSWYISWEAMTDKNPLFKKISKKKRPTFTKRPF